VEGLDWLRLFVLDLIKQLLQFFLTNGFDDVIGSAQHQLSENGLVKRIEEDEFSKDHLTIHGVMSEAEVSVVEQSFLSDGTKTEDLAHGDPVTVDHAHSKLVHGLLVLGILLSRHEVTAKRRGVLAMHHEGHNGFK
jgi:hypothetical protein